MSIEDAKKKYEHLINEALTDKQIINICNDVPDFDVKIHIITLYGFRKSKGKIITFFKEFKENNSEFCNNLRQEYESMK